MSVAVRENLGLMDEAQRVLCTPLALAASRLSRAAGTVSASAGFQWKATAAVSTRPDQPCSDQGTLRVRRAPSELPWSGQARYSPTRTSSWRSIAATSCITTGSLA